jgi:hypothetical protein
MEEIKIGNEYMLDDIHEDIKILGIEYYFDDAVFDLEIGKHDKVLKGSYSFPTKYEDGNPTEYTNYVFETVGEYEVIKNIHGNVYDTIINRDSIKVKITDIEII